MKQTHKTTSGIDLRYTVQTTTQPTDSCVVLLPGIPYNPEKDYLLISLLIQEGYDTYLIHYDGTWGSSGKFLAKNPKESIEDFIEALGIGKIPNATSQEYTKIYVIGTSFGGGLALTLKDRTSLKTVCALSPVISYTSVNEIKTLGQYLKDDCADHYDFDMSNMDALISDKIITPETQFTLPAKKVLVFGGSHDEQIPFSNISNFCKKHDLKLKECPTGHITFSKVTEDIYKMIADSLN